MLADDFFYASGVEREAAGFAVGQKAGFHIDGRQEFHIEAGFTFQRGR